MTEAIDLTDDEELDEPELFEWEQECTCCDDLDEWYPDDEEEDD